MTNENYRQILQRVGVLLLIVGILDIGWMVYTIAHGRSYSSSLNIFAVVAGILLMRGGLKTAGVVRWFLIFMLTALITLLPALPFVQPFGLTMMQIRSQGTEIAGNAAVTLSMLVLLYWVARELGREPVLAARAAAGLKRQDMRIPFVLGVLLVIAMAVGAHWMQGLFSAQQAIAKASGVVGDGYQFHVQSLQVMQSSNTKSVRAVVTAWNDTEIREIPVEWKEAR